MKSLFFAVFTIFVISFPVFTQIPAGYYGSAEGKREAALKTALYNIIKDHTDVGYDGLWEVYRESDKTSDGKIWDMYSTCTWTYGNAQCGNYKTVCDCYNREHSIPQSWFDKRLPMKSDAFHIYPTDGKVNGQRNNYPFGECTGGVACDNSQKALGRLGKSTFAGYTGIVFEPDDKYKGDFARTYFYFATRYENIMTSIDGDSFNNTAYPAFSTWSLNLFLKWHRQDTVSQKEKDRNNAIAKFQKNRNPFIDCPELAEFIWGNRRNDTWNGLTGTENTSSSLKITMHKKSLVVSGNANTSETLAYTVYNSIGQTLRSGTLSAGNGEISLNELSAGVYVIRLKNSTLLYVNKFFVPINQ